MLHYNVNNMVLSNFYTDSRFVNAKNMELHDMSFKFNANAQLYFYITLNCGIPVFAIKLIRDV